MKVNARKILDSITDFQPGKTAYWFGEPVTLVRPGQKGYWVVRRENPALEQEIGMSALDFDLDASDQKRDRLENTVKDFVELEKIFLTKDRANFRSRARRFIKLRDSDVVAARAYLKRFAPNLSMAEVERLLNGSNQPDETLSA